MVPRNVGILPHHKLEDLDLNFYRRQNFKSRTVLKIFHSVE
jgi:hypothetical protein